MSCWCWGSREMGQVWVETRSALNSKFRVKHHLPTDSVGIRMTDGWAHHTGSITASLCFCWQDEAPRDRLMLMLLTVSTDWAMSHKHSQRKNVYHFYFEQHSLLVNAMQKQQGKDYIFLWLYCHTIHDNNQSLTWWKKILCFSVIICMFRGVICNISPLNHLQTVI